MVDQQLEAIKQERLQRNDLLADVSMGLSLELSSSNLNLGGQDHMAGVSYLPMIDPTTIILKGYLLKKNWYGNEQKRYFELYPEGLIKYFEIKGKIRVYKSCLSLGPNTVLIK